MTRVLHVINTCDPRDGGPSEGLRCMADATRRLGIEVEIVSLDAPEGRFADGFGMPIHEIGPRSGSYARTATLSPWIRRNASRFDAVFVHGIWQHHNLAVREGLRGQPVPYFIFPHGMLDPWFRRAFPLKHLKKSLFWPLQHRVLREAHSVLFTCEEERRLARQTFRPYRVTERVVPFGTKAPPPPSPAQTQAFYSAVPGAAGKRALLFLGRIHPKKGLDLLVEAFAEAMGGKSGWVLVVAGPDQAGWKPRIEAKAERLGVAGRILWPGMLLGDAKWGAFRSAEAFVLPSHQENFGIAVAEALGCGTPVLISDKVNIWREVDLDGAGWIAPDTAAGCKRLFDRLLSSSAAERAAMSTRASECFSRRFDAARLGESLAELVEEAKCPSS
ncbi:MAG TPA: glycosyltransferase [Fimbriimonas sp.]